MVSLSVCLPSVSSLPALLPAAVTRLAVRFDIDIVKWRRFEHCHTILHGKTYDCAAEVVKNKLQGISA
jgi:hypothetical protein